VSRIEQSGRMSLRRPKPTIKEEEEITQQSPDVEISPSRARTIHIVGP